MNVTLVMRYTENPKWGVETVAYNTIEGLVKRTKQLEERDIMLKILSNTNRSPNVIHTQITPNIEIIYYHIFPPTTFIGDIQQFMIYNKMAQKSDVIHSHDLTFSFSIMRKYNKKLFHQIHGLVWNEKKYVNSKYLKFSYNISTIRNLALSKFSIKHPIEFVAISYYVSKELHNVLKIPKDKIHIIYDPVSDEFFNIEKKETPGLLFYPARLIPRKNQLNLIKALGILKKEGIDFQMFLTGKIEDVNYYNQLISEVEKHGLQKNVTFLGLINKETLIEYYSKSSVVVLTSFEETFSLTVAEAMATGTPVIASPVGIVPEIVIDYKTGFKIEPNNPEDIAKKLNIVLCDDKLRKTMGINARYLADAFKSEKVADSLISLWMGANE